MSTATAEKTATRGRPVGSGRMDFRKHTVTSDNEVSFQVIMRFDKAWVIVPDGPDVPYNSLASFRVALHTAASRHPEHINAYSTKLAPGSKNVYNVTIVKTQHVTAA